jgi:hypothetical protein
MADKRKELEANLNKLSLSRDRIAVQLEEAEKKAIQLQEKVNHELMDGESSGSIQELSFTRERISSLHQALQFGNSQVSEARQRLSDYDQAVRYEVVINLDKKVKEAVVDLQARIGEAGLKAEVDKLGALVLALERSMPGDKMDQDVSIRLNSARNIYNHLSSSLLESWNVIEGLKWGPRHSMVSGRPNYIPGFGVRPGFLTSE